MSRVRDEFRRRLEAIALLTLAQPNWTADDMVSVIHTVIPDTTGPFSADIIRNDAPIVRRLLLPTNDAWSHRDLVRACYVAGVLTGISTATEHSISLGDGRRRIIPDAVLSLGVEPFVVIEAKPTLGGSNALAAALAQVTRYADRIEDECDGVQAVLLLGDTGRYDLDAVAAHAQQSHVEVVLANDLLGWYRALLSDEYVEAIYA